MKRENVRLVLTLLLSVFGFLAFIVVTLTGVHDKILSIAVLKLIAMRDLVEASYIFFAGLFIGLYALMAFFCIPALVIMSTVGGYFFGLFGLLFSALGCSVGSVLFLFLSSGSVRKFAFQLGVISKIGIAERAFKKSSLLGVFLIRLMPVIPFSVGSLTIVVFPTTSTSVFLGTFLGVLPGTAIYTLLGSALASVDLITAVSDPTQFFTFDIIMPALAVLLITLICAISARRL